MTHASDLPQLQDHLKRLGDAMTVFENESDRSAAIAAATYLEVALELVLLQAMEHPNRNLFNGTQPLATFSARIELAYALGLLSDPIYGTINLVRKIRNVFAHSFEEISFDTPEIRDRVAAIDLFGSPSMNRYVLGNGPPRERYLVAVVSLVGWLSGRHIQDPGAKAGASQADAEVDDRVE